ncbi:MAG TPA: hypothetical protein VIA18_26505, partial [Polyangia bacterium]|nr:hypothetical protein [Polyangia bacterium]
TVSKAFKGAKIHYAKGDVSMKTTLAVNEVVPELGSGSNLDFEYANKAVTLKGTLKPQPAMGPVKFDVAKSAITASWSSASPTSFAVTGGASADVAGLAKVDMTVEAGKDASNPASFKLNGVVDATKLAEGMKNYVSFSSVNAKFDLMIGGGEKTELDFGITAAINGIPAAGINDVQATFNGNYHNGKGIDATLAVQHVKIGDVVADGNIQVVQNKFSSGELHVKAAFPGVDVEGTAHVTAGDGLALSTSTELKVTPGAGSPLSSFIKTGSINVAIANWKLTQASGTLHLVPPEFLALEDPTIVVSYAPGTGLSAKLTTQFESPFKKDGKGTFEAGYISGTGLYAKISFPITVPGFEKAEVSGQLDGNGISVGATLTPKQNQYIKEAKVSIGYGGGGFIFKGTITLTPDASTELEVGVEYSQAGGLQIIGITPTDKHADDSDHQLAGTHKDLDIPLASVGVASLALRLGFGVAAGYRMPKVKLQNPKLEGGLDALDSGGLPPISFGGEISMGSYLALSFSVQIVGEIQLLVASASVGIGAEIVARLNLDLGAKIAGTYRQGEGAKIQIDPYVAASLDLIANLIATL